MEYLGRTPAPPLDTFIERIWYCSDAPLHTRERVLPGGGTIDLVDEEIRIYDPADPGSIRSHTGSIVSGTSTRSFFVDPRQRACMVGVHFRPAGAFPFLGISPAEIVDTQVQLDDLWGCDSRRLRDQLLDVGSPGEQLRLMEEALRRRLLCARPGHPAMRAAVNALAAGGNDVRVAEVATVVGLSYRRFIQIFELEVGLKPKLYARLQRFHRVKQRIARLLRSPPWATFALDCGYYDQSHMIRDFVEFSGMSPAGYLRCRTEETLFDHVVHTYPRQHGVARAGDTCHQLAIPPVSVRSTANDSLC